MIEDVFSSVSEAALLGDSLPESREAAAAESLPAPPLHLRCHDDDDEDDGGGGGGDRKNAIGSGK